MYVKCAYNLSALCSMRMSFPWYKTLNNCTFPLRFMDAFWRAQFRFCLCFSKRKCVHYHGEMQLMADIVNDMHQYWLSIGWKLKTSWKRYKTHTFDRPCTCEFVSYCEPNNSIESCGNGERFFNLKIVRITECTLHMHSICNNWPIWNQ